MNPIEKAYKAWRSAVKPRTINFERVLSPRVTHPLTVTDKPRKYAGTGRRKRTISAEQRESYRRGALKMWKRRKAERRA